MPRDEQSRAHSPKVVKSVQVQSESKLEKSKLISIRVDVLVLERLQKLARKQQKGYQTLLKQFVMERLDEEEQKSIAQ
ncbi:hypothetical protein JZ785_03315 [Alicyclobacillus curvatus]|nr:hypothetical protein JZ785_03315 [Alicyclobacillus curvatus]